MNFKNEAFHYKDSHGYALFISGHMKSIGKNIRPTRVAQNATMAAALPDPMSNFQESQRAKDLIPRQLCLLHGKGCSTLHHWPELNPMTIPGRRYLRKVSVQHSGLFKRQDQGKVT